MLLWPRAVVSLKLKTLWWRRSSKLSSHLVSPIRVSSKLAELKTSITKWYRYLSNFNLTLGMTAFETTFSKFKTKRICQRKLHFKTPSSHLKSQNRRKRICSRESESTLRSIETKRWSSLASSSTGNFSRGSLCPKRWKTPYIQVSIPVQI